MYVDNGIAYAGERAQPLTVVGVRPLEGHRLWVRFSSGEIRVFDFKPLLETPAFSPLADRMLFSAVGIDHGVPVWNDGDIDISPDMLYRDGSLA
ncbi:MAG: DUF2442 domain-containing protein [Kiritimatiellaeota bacterium]|nr:DUF2442 domain-containing protein [Kiritimatiellota bacterium]